MTSITPRRNSRTKRESSVTTRKRASVTTVLLGVLASRSFAAAFVSKPQSSRTVCALRVLSSSPPESSTTKKQSEGDDQEKQPDLFKIEETGDNVGELLYQVHPAKKVEDGEDGEEENFEPQILSNESMDPDDLSFFYRDDDDILTEREDRMYMDENGIRRKVEKCILVAVEDLSAMYKARKADMYYDPLNDETDAPLFTLEESMIEMRELIKTAGLKLSGELTQRLQEVNPRTYIGTGKVQEALKIMEEADATTIVFDAELSPGQQKSLENTFNRNLIQNDFLVQEREIKVVDRTALILDIFAQHAKTREGKLQVDLALHEYRKPRLTKMWTHLERQSGAGGVGLRGPGESQLEIDRRLVRDRIIVLKQRIDDVQKQRELHRRGRQRTGLPVLSLVGYTNAGKSSLLNSLTRAGVMADSMLFATLDPTTRKVKLPGYKTHPEVLMTDTVGFIQKLPTNLVAAFRATLEEVREADVLIHVIDVSNPAWKKQEQAVRSVLSDIGIKDKPIVSVWNKIDLLDSEDAEYLKYEAAFSDSTVAVSAVHGEGLQDFVGVVEEAMAELLVPVEMEIPYSEGQKLNAIHEQGNVETVDYRPNGTYILGRLPKALANRLAEYTVNQEAIPVVAKKRKDDDEIDWVALGRGRHNQELSDSD